MTIPAEWWDVQQSENLLSQARQGDGEAFCELLGAHEQRLYQQAVALCGNLASAEDLVAETMVEAWKSLRRFDGTCRFSTWLYAILLHRFQKMARRARSRPLPLASLSAQETETRERLLARLSDEQPLPAEVLQHQELAARLQDAVQALPLKHQQVVLLRFFEEASLPEIAAALEVSVGTVKSRLHYALVKLRQMESLVNLRRTARDTTT